MTIRRSTAAPSAVIACVIILLSVVLITVGITYATEPSELPDPGIQSEASADASDSVAGPFDDSSQPPSDSSAGEESTVKPPEESSDTSSAPEFGQSIPAMSAGTFNSVGTQYCILYDVTHDAILYSKNSAERAYPASVTKLLTAAVASEYCQPDTPFTVGDEQDFVQEGSSLAYLQRGQRLTFEGLLDAMLLPSGNDNAEVLKDLMKLAHKVLDHHPINEKRRAEGKLPANGVWFWAEGSAVALDSFWDKYHKTGTVISAVPLCFGIARLSGLDIREVEGATGELETNYEGKVAAALDELHNGKDFVAVHVEAPDECTHNGDLPGKLQAIEWLDSRVIGPITQALADEGTDFRLLILSDHKTLTATRGHDADPVPYLLYDSRKDTGLNLPYCEESGLKGTAYAAGAPVLMRKLFEQL